MMLLKIKGCIPNNKTRLLTIKNKRDLSNKCITELCFSSRGLERVIVSEVPGEQPSKLSPYLRLFRQTKFVKSWVFLQLGTIHFTFLTFPFGINSPLYCTTWTSWAALIIARRFLQFNTFFTFPFGINSPLYRTTWTSWALLTIRRRFF